MRTIIDLPQDQLDALDSLCDRQAISRAEAIRQAVALLIQQRGATASGKAFGLWKGRRATDGVRYQERIRREWRQRANRRAR